MQILGSQATFFRLAHSRVLDVSIIPLRDALWKDLEYENEAEGSSYLPPREDFLAELFSSRVLGPFLRFLGSKVHVPVPSHRFCEWQDAVEWWQ